MIWDQALITLPGIGPKRAELLEEMGLTTIGNLFSFLPYRYIDASTITPIAHLVVGETSTIQAKILSTKAVRTRRGQSFVTVRVEDDSGELAITFFHQPYVAAQLKEGEWFAFTGKAANYRERLSLTNPAFESMDKEDQIHTGRIIPVYSQHETLKTAWLRKTLFGTLKLFADNVEEYLPAEILQAESLTPRKEALWQTHFPETLEAAEQGKKRLAFDELWQVFSSLRQQTLDRHARKASFVLHEKPDELVEWYQKALPFPLTSSQYAACRNLAEQLSQGFPIFHLVQGEVGSGKTYVAGFALALAARFQGQALYLAPTSILAGQHWQTLSPVFQKLGLECSLWTSAEKHSAEAPVIIGTHALLSGKTIFHPGLVVIDEEHRFGVNQRTHFWNQDPQPHLISMTATPIPRTLAFTLFGEQEASFLELIPGKEKQITTRLIPATRLEPQWEWLKEQISDQKTQAFLIAPLISPSDAEGFGDIYDATSLYKRAKKALKPYKVEILTGQTPAAEKKAILAAMGEGSIDVLVATPVIEVGIDIPQASIITITSAERFGLAQLHQLRGRVGRAGQVSWCFLVPSPGVPPLERLKKLETLSDGAALAELDLSNRGVGEFLGTRQTGWDTLQIATWLDLELLQQVRRVWESIFTKI